MTAKTKNILNACLFLVIVIAITLVITGCATTTSLKYNHLEEHWSNTKTTDELKYNYHDGKWSYESPGSELKYNIYNEKWEWTK